MSKLFEFTKLNLERTIQNLVAKKSEFVYTDNDGTVPENKNYSMYYLTDKRELYFTGLITSKYVRQLTRIKNRTLYSEYTSLKSVNRGVYPSSYIPQLTDKDYTVKSISRFFVKKINETNSEVLEISEHDFDKELKVYNKITLNWIISGTKENVMLENLKTINGAEKSLKGISKILFPLQYYKPSKEDKYETTEKKLLLLKTN